jgi:RecA-family ATPase
VLYISAEDSSDELHRRVDAIAKAENIGLDRLESLHLLSLAGEDAVLATCNEGDLVRATPLWTHTTRLVERLGPALVIYDTLADLFAGNENSRPQARQFVQMLRGLALRTHSAALLLSHPSLSGLSSGSGTSGSTAWSNSVRSRLYFQRDELDPDARVLRTMKANYAGIGTEIRVRWQDWTFVPIQGGGDSNRSSQQLTAETIFLQLLTIFEETGRTVSPNPSKSHAPTLFAAEERGKPIGKKALQAAMSRLLEAGTIRAVAHGAPSRQSVKLEVAR